MLKKLRKNIALFLLLFSSFKSLQAANERDNNNGTQENASSNQANRAYSWRRKWMTELGTQLGYHSLCSIGYYTLASQNIDPTYIIKSHPFFIYVSVQILYISDKHIVKEYKPNTQKDCNKELAIDLITGLAGGFTGIAVKKYLKKEDIRDIGYNFSASCLVGVGLYRLGRLAKKLYTKGYSRLEYEDITPPSDIIGALTTTWAICKKKKKKKKKKFILV